MRAWLRHSDDTSIECHWIGVLQCLSGLPGGTAVYHIIDIVTIAM